MSNLDKENQSKMIEIKEKGLIRKILDKILSFLSRNKKENISDNHEQTSSPAYTWSTLPTEVIENDYLPTADYDGIEEDDYFSSENMITNKESYDIVMEKLSSGELNIGDLSIPDALRINSMLETELELKQDEVSDMGIINFFVEDVNTNDNEN